ncbi:Porin D precursor [compost metagenome]
MLRQSNESHHEVGAYVSYAVQSGWFRGANVLSGYSWHRASQYQVEGNLDEFRLIVNAPFKIF